MNNSNRGETSTTAGGGVTFIGLLTVVFITLKLLGHIDWSWWWVLSPMWISFGVAMLFVAGLAAVIYARS